MTKSNTQEESNMASYAEAFKRGPKSETTDSLSSVKPVFVEESDVFSHIPKEATRGLFLTISEMYKAVGAVVPDRSVMGLQRIKGLWRIYLDTLKGKEFLLSEGLEIRGKSISIYSMNPRVRIQENSTDVKIRIKDVPLSADDGQILRALEGYNCVILKHLRERLRYNDMITNCQTGDRIVYCEGPLTSAIPKSIPIGKYRATVIYRGQQNDNIKCNKCMELGHTTKNCENDWKCRICGESGHRQNECTSEMSSEQEQEGATSANHENHYDPSDVNTQPTNNNENLDAMQPTENEAHAENDSASNTITYDDSIRSQSILTEDQSSSPICDQQNQPPAARPKIKPGRRETNKPSHTSSEATSRNSRGQSQITSFIHGPNQSTRRNQHQDTPVKTSNKSGLEKSPVTPTEKLHDGASNNTSKKSKTTKI
ncbi:unnamed protein product [Mytilus edulis]|uniref:CCHC-type domain-containing protein n=1 Tax=Mytilus edulis TaxID=6550 RepID=A0A8S3Q174_MYTED|nr:unnamed protein product [Mytilus edulis]